MINQGDGIARLERLEHLVSLLDAGDDSTAILSNRVQQTSPTGTVVAGGGAITLDAALTTVGLGKIRISANFNGVPAVGALCTPILQVKIGGGAFVTQFAWSPSTGVAGDPIDCSTVFEFDSAAPSGTILTVHWQTDAGDGALTLGGGAVAGALAAVLLVEELT